MLELVLAAAYIGYRAYRADTIGGSAPRHIYVKVFLLLFYDINLL